MKHLDGYIPFMKNGVMGFKYHTDKGTVYIYLNPSSADSEGEPNVFLYKGTTGDPVTDQALTHITFGDRHEAVGD